MGRRLFDPSGKLRDPNSLRSIFLGPTRTPRSWEHDGMKMTELVGPDGGTAAVQAEHGDGRVDATVYAQPVQLQRGGT